MNDIERIRVLLVEDDDEDTLVFSRFIRKLAGYSVSLERVSVPDRAEFALTTGHYDIVFLDLNLGAALTGMEFLKRMRNIGMKTPFIIVTGSGDRVQAVEAMKNGAYDYLVKDSLSPDLIERTIRSARKRFALEQERDLMTAKLNEMIATDELTAVANRRRLMEKLNEEGQRSGRTGRPFALLMIDLDRFKTVNDRYGHQTGDLVLRECAATLQSHVRATDLVARYGGEEFCIVMPEAELEGAAILAERLRAAIMRLPDPVPTVSIGVAVWQDGFNIDRVLSDADKALYRAKESGRNCVAAAGDARSPARSIAKPPASPAA